MEIVREVIELLFKLSIILFAIITTHKLLSLYDYIKTLDNLINSQIKYTDILRTKIERLEKELERKKK